MAKNVALVIPEAPMPARSALAEQRKVESRGIRLGILNNSKANADHLLRFLVAGVKTALPVASVVWLSKDSAAKPAPGEMLDRLAAETDFVVSAMAD